MTENTLNLLYGFVVSGTGIVILKLFCITDVQTEQMNQHINAGNQRKDADMNRGRGGRICR